MPYAEIKLPPGVFKNGVERQARGRWFDCNLVRWFEGALRPIGGWTEHASGLSGAVRALITWADNSATQWIAAGSHDHLYVIDRSGAAYDITPVGLTSGSADAVIGGGYGNSGYGDGDFGAPGLDPGLVHDCTVWSLDTFGENLVGCNADDGTLYKWSLATGTPVAAIVGAPTNCRAIVVTADGFLMALGADGNPRLVQWCDRQDETNWTAGLPSEAGNFPLQTAGRLMCGRRVRGGTLLFTDVDVHLAEYNDPANPFGFDKVGADCGVISQGAALVVSDSLAAWMGRDGFFVYDGNVRSIPCEVSDYVFGDINRIQSCKVAAVYNPAFGEVTWFYPSAVSAENDRYVTWNTRENHWAVGRLARTCGAAKGVFPHPLLADAAGVVWAHEAGFTYSGDHPYAECGPVELGDGERVLTAINLIPDETALGSVQATFYGRLLPTEADAVFGPYPAASRTNVRFTARQLRMRLTGVAGEDWRIGGFKLELRQGGSR